MSDERLHAELRRRYDEISSALDRAGSGSSREERDRLRDTIVSLFRDTEAAIDELTKLKESIRPLVDRYRGIFRGAGSGADADHPDRVVRIDHLGSSTYLERGWNAIAGGNYEIALTELESALELAPGNSRAEALLGWALMKLGRGGDARALLEPLLKREPDNHLARANLGYVCMREGRFAEAIDHLSRVARESADRTAGLYARLYLGMVYAEREMYRDAELLLSRALDFGPNLIEAYWELGRVHYRAGDTSAACAAWRQGADTNRYNPWGERCGEAADRLTAGEPVSLD